MGANEPALPPVEVFLLHTVEVYNLVCNWKICSCVWLVAGVHVCVRLCRRVGVRAWFDEFSVDVTANVHAWTFSVVCKYHIWLVNGGYMQQQIGDFAAINSVNTDAQKLLEEAIEKHAVTRRGDHDGASCIRTYSMVYRHDCAHHQNTRNCWWWKTKKLRG